MMHLFPSAILVMALSSCMTQQPLYSWYDSEDATYKYTKRATDATLANAMAQYEKVVKRQNGTRKTVPPGVNAEYGFLLCKAGKKTEGLALLREETKLYPESEKFISRIIKQLEK
jgi:hypothetical protein